MSSFTEVHIMLITVHIVLYNPVLKPKPLYSDAHWGGSTCSFHQGHTGVEVVHLHDQPGDRVVHLPDQPGDRVVHLHDQPGDRVVHLHDQPGDRVVHLHV